MHSSDQETVFDGAVCAANCGADSKGQRVCEKNADCTSTDLRPSVCVPSDLLPSLKVCKPAF
jgi:hypothetical protein